MDGYGDSAVVFLSYGYIFYDTSIGLLQETLKILKNSLVQHTDLCTLLAHT